MTSIINYQYNQILQNNYYLQKIKRKQFLYRNIDKSSLIITDKVDSTLINSLKNVFECTFAYDTVFKLIHNANCFGIKCMVIKERDRELESLYPHYWLEWDKIYSELRNNFHIIYFLYYPIYGKMFMYLGNDLEEHSEIISGIIPDIENKKHINTCLNYFRKMYLEKNYVLPNKILLQ